MLPFNAHSLPSPALLLFACWFQILFDKLAGDAERDGDLPDLVIPRKTVVKSQLKDVMYQDAGACAMLGLQQDQLDEDSKRRLTTNPLRILDSKEPSTQALLTDAPKLADFLGTESKIHFEQVQAYLTTLGIDYEINPHLVRGLDYYNGLVFEFVTDSCVKRKNGCYSEVCFGMHGIIELSG